MTLTRTLGLIAFAFITFITNPGFAQQELVFRVKYLPNTTYATEVVSDIKMEMDFPGDTAKRNQILAKGGKLPIQTDMLQEMGLSTRTGALTADKRIPVTISYDKVAIKMNVAGREMPHPGQFAGLKVKGYATEDGKLSVDTIMGKSAELKEAIGKMMSQVMNKVTFPDKHMKPGDTFIQELPMEMPAGPNSISFMIKTIYMLKEIKGDLALFDFTQNVNLDLSMQPGGSTATGSGAGKMVYNIPDSYITETDSDMMMDMTMTMREMTMKMTARVKSSLKARVL